MGWFLKKRILAHHLILSSYGFWLPNDPRGSGSEDLREGKFEDLGEIHHGRKRLQPTRAELRAFYVKAFPKLEHAPIWFDDGMRDAIAGAFREVIERNGYTVWACAIGSNHAHLCVRYHRDRYENIWMNLVSQARVAVLARSMVGSEHPVWAHRPYSVFCCSTEDIGRTIAYIEGNPGKEGLSGQIWPFVRAYDGWPVLK